MITGAVNNGRLDIVGRDFGRNCDVREPHWDILGKSLIEKGADERGAANTIYILKS